MESVQGFHAHVYFDESTYPQAKTLCEQAGDLFALRVGRFHKKPVGPHPRWSCQLAFKPEYFGQIIPWLSLNRNGLTVFVHSETGDDLKDHTDHAIWMGRMEVLDLSIFKNTGSTATHT
jgi:aromatic ring-cleaving dioxygenase